MRAYDLHAFLILTPNNQSNEKINNFMFTYSKCNF